MRRAVWALGVLACAAGCGGRSDSENGEGGGVTTCDAFTPCGGDVVGSWEITSTCIDESAAVTVGDCENTAVDYRSYEVDGGYVFDSSGNVTLTFDSEFSYVWEIPRMCLFDYTCAEIEALLTSLTGTNTGSGTIEFDASCPDAPTVCRCDVSGFITGTNSGTYTTAGSTMTVVTAESTSVQEYCIVGDNLAVQSEEGGFDLTRN